MEGSRLKMVGLEALPTYKRVVAWFLHPVVDMERYFQQLHRLNLGLNTSQWTLHECKEESNRFRHILSIDSLPVAVLQEMKWHPFTSAGQETFSLLNIKPEGRKQEESRREGGGGRV